MCLPSASVDQQTGWAKGKIRAYLIWVKEKELTTDTPLVMARCAYMTSARWFDSSLKSSTGLMQKATTDSCLLNDLR